MRGYRARASWRFGDSWTTGEITAPIGIGTGPVTKLVVVPAASYPSQLQMLLVARYSSQMPLLLTGNAIFEF